MRKVVGCKGGWYGIMGVLCMRWLAVRVDDVWSYGSYDFDDVWGW